MTLLFPDDGLVMQLERILTASVKYHLFTNNIVPDTDTVIGDLTEAAWTGYAAVTQGVADFTVKGVASHQGYAIAPAIEFDNSSGGDVDAYGYYVTDTGVTKLLAIALFDSAPVTIPDGGTQAVIPVWGDVQA